MEGAVVEVESADIVVEHTFALDLFGALSQPLFNKPLDVSCRWDRFRAIGRDIALHKEGSSRSSVRETIDERAPFLFTACFAGIHVGRAIVVGGFDDPVILVRAYGSKVAVFIGKEIGGRNLLFYEGVLLVS